MIPTEFKVRRPLPDDVEYMIKTWGREIAHAQPRKLFRDKKSTFQASAFPQRLFYDEYQREVILPLTRKAQARVVCPVSDPEMIACFVVGESFPEVKTFVAHFAFTRPAFRRLGLCRAACEDIGYAEGHEIVATAWTRFLNRFDRADLIYNWLTLFQVRE